MALLDGAIPMRCMFVSTGLATMQDGELREAPGVKEVENAKAIHSLAFSSQGDLLAIESEGAFSLDEWGVVERKAKVVCLGNRSSTQGSQLAQLKQPFEQQA